MELYFHGVGPLHRGFFAAEEATEHLGEALGACLVDTAQVWVTYDTENRIGHIYLKVPPETAGACLPQLNGEVVEVASLAPVGRALAAYRDRVASNFDFRVANFQVGASFTRGAKSCTLWAAGQFPPDGSTFSPCIQLHDREVCGGDRKDGVTTIPLSGADLAYVRECFRR